MGLEKRQSQVRITYLELLLCPLRLDFGLNLRHIDGL